MDTSESSLPSPTNDPALGCCASRRTVLGQTLLGGVVAAGAAVGLAACAPEPKPQAVPSATGTGHDVLAVSELPVGAQAAVAINKANVLLYRQDEKTVLAYSAVCTHAGCKVEPSENTQFYCGCHSSTFNATDGSVVSGPAPRPLERWAAAIEGDRVMVYL